MSEIDPTDIEAIQQKQAEKKQHARHLDEIRNSDLQRLMSAKWGRRIIWRLLEDCGVFRSTFNESALLMAFKEGNRNLGNQYLAEITSLCPDRYIEMLKENKHGPGKHKRS